MKKILLICLLYSLPNIIFAQFIVINSTIILESCAPGNDGSITVIPSGGTPPYFYTWSPGFGISTATLTNLSAGNYSLTVTDANGISNTANIVVPSAQAPNVSAGTLNPSCNGLSDGTINLAVMNGNAPLTYLWNNGNISKDLIGVPAGNYSVTVTGALGCSATHTYLLTDPSPLNKTINAAANTIRSNQSNALYQWLDCNNNYAPIQGATSQSYTATIPGNYAVELTFARCVDTSNCFNVISVGLDEKVDEEIQFSAYPNPSQGELNLQILKEDLNQRFRIFDLSGKVVFEEMVLNLNTKLNLEGLQSGIYFMDINEKRKKLVLIK